MNIARAVASYDFEVWEALRVAQKHADASLCVCDRMTYAKDTSTHVVNQLQNTSLAPGPRAARKSG